MGRKVYPNHVGISVRNVDEAIEWYKDIFGFELIEKVYVDHIDCYIAVIRNGDFDIELFEHKNTVPIEESRKHPDGDTMYQGTKHICFRVDGLDDFIKEVQAKGVKVLLGPGEFGTNRFYYINDPSGILIEVNEPLKA